MTPPLPEAEKRDVRISKSLSYLLRHGAVKEGLTIDESGYVTLDQLLNHNRLKTNKVTLDDIQRVVTNNNKQRFSLVQDSQNRFHICANQGHSLQVNDDNLVEIQARDELPKAIFHGTYSRNMDSIHKQGLKAMTRNHIHLTDNFNYIRPSCNVVIYIDIDKCLGLGVKFYKSKNNVYLTRGIEGTLLEEYFARVMTRKEAETETETEAEAGTETVDIE